jgi:hypothetical protein
LVSGFAAAACTDGNPAVRAASADEGGDLALEVLYRCPFAGFHLPNIRRGTYA